MFDDTSKTSVEVNVTIQEMAEDVRNMSEAELYQRIAEVRQSRSGCMRARNSGHVFAVDNVKHDTVVQNL